MELLDGVDFIAEEFDADRMSDGRREHVEDAAAHRELSAVHDQIDAGVGVLDKTGRGLVERKLLPRRKNQRFDITQPGDDRLDERTHRHDQNLNRSKQGVPGFRMRQTTEYRHAGRDRVCTRGEPFMRQRLPGLKFRDILRIAVIPAANRLNGFLRFPSRRHDGNDWGSLCGRRCESRSNAGHGFHIEHRLAALIRRHVDQSVRQIMEGPVVIELVEQSGKRSGGRCNRRSRGRGGSSGGSGRRRGRMLLTGH